MVDPWQLKQLVPGMRSARSRLLPADRHRLVLP
jgi:hypothetical protein